MKPFPCWCRQTATRHPLYIWKRSDCTMQRVWMSAIFQHTRSLVKLLVTASSSVMALCEGGPMDPHSRAPKKNTSHGNEVLPQDTTHLLQRPCYQRGSPWQDPAGNWTTQRSPDHRKETQTALVWSCLPFIRSGKNHLARHSERGKKTRQTEEEMGRQHQGMDRAGVHQVPEGSGEQGKMEKTGYEIVCGAPPTLAVKG